MIAGLRRLETLQQLRNRHPESLGESLKSRQADVFLPALHIRDVATVDSDLLGHLDLRPALPFAKVAQPCAEPLSDVCRGHLAIIICRLRTTNRLKPILLQTCSPGEARAPSPPQGLSFSGVHLGRGCMRFRSYAATRALRVVLAPWKRRSKSSAIASRRVRKGTFQRIREKISGTQSGSAPQRLWLHAS